MKIAELIEILSELPQDALVVQSRDAEGNGFSPTADIGIGRWQEESTWSGEVALYELTETLKKQGYTEEDVGDGPVCVCFWPTN